MLFYRAYDLSVVSDAAVPGLVEILSTERPDVQLFFRAAPPAPSAPGWQPWFESPYRSASGRPTLTAQRSADSSLVRFNFDDGPAFTLDGAAGRVWIRAHDSETNGFASALPYLLGPVFGILLRMRGVTCLHASAVVLDDGAHVFVGAEGAGKSTLAAQFAADAIPILTDDIVALRLRDGRWFVAPGYPRVRLWDDAVAALPIERGAIPPPMHGSSRSQLDLTRAGAFAIASQPLAAVYLLEYDAALAAPGIEPVAPTDALPVLSANTFAERVLSREQRAGEFTALADLVAAVPVRRLRRRPSIAHLAAASGLVRRTVPAVNRYAVYGCTVQANRAIAALAPAAADGEPAIAVRLVAVPSMPAHAETTERYVSAFKSNTQRPMLRAGVTAGGIHVLDYWDGARCSMDARGSSIVLESPPGAGDPEEFLLGLGLSFALRLRGELVAHAAAVHVDGEAVLLAGLPGAGKSTFTAALQVLGHDAITDDVSVIEARADRHVLHAGPGRLRLRADARALLEQTIGRPIAMAPSPDGHHLDLPLPPTRLKGAPFTVRAIYWLERIDAGTHDRQPALQSLSAAEAVVRLVSDTWGARLLDADMRRHEFDQACALIGPIHTRVLRYANGPANLLAATECLVRDAVTAAVRERIGA